MVSLLDVLFVLLVDLLCGRCCLVLLVWLPCCVLCFVCVIVCCFGMGMVVFLDCRQCCVYCRSVVLVLSGYCFLFFGN